MWNTSLAVGLAAVVLSCGCGTETGGRVHRVEMKGMTYAPAELATAPGDRVVWTNHDIVPHSATADQRQFDSASIAPSAEWSLTVQARGRIPYACTFHPTMKALLVVK